MNFISATLLNPSCVNTCVSYAAAFGGQKQCFFFSREEDWTSACSKSVIINFL